MMLDAVSMRSLGRDSEYTIGTKNHRKRVIRFRKLNPNDRTTRDDVHIIKDGEAIHSLGAWIGNKTQEQRPWETVRDAVYKHLIV